MVYKANALKFTVSPEQNDLTNAGANAVSSYKPNIFALGL